MIFNSWVFDLMVFILLFVLVIYTYTLIEKRMVNNFNDNDARISSNAFVWLLVVIFFAIFCYRKGQINSMEGKIYFKPKVVKTYDKRTGKLIDTDTTYVFNHDVINNK